MDDLTVVITCFSLKDTDLEIDTFETSTTCSKEYLIRSKDNKILFYDGEFQARNLAEPGKMQPEKYCTLIQPSLTRFQQL